LLRSNYGITSKQFTIGSTPLVSAVTEKLLAKQRAVTVDQFSLIPSGGVMQRYADALAQRLNLERLVLKLKAGKVQRAERALEDLRGETKQVATTYLNCIGQSSPCPHAPDLDRRLKELKSEIRAKEDEVGPSRALVAMAEAVGGRFDSFATAATSATKDAGYPPLILAAMREGLLCKPPIYTHVLYVGTEGSGGETVTRQKLLGTLDRAVFMGGTQLSYLLLDVAAGKTVAAGTESLLGYVSYDLKNGRADPLRRIQVDNTG
jgi:hypothetical protein